MASNLYFNSMPTDVLNISDAQRQAIIKRFNGLYKDTQKKINALNLGTTTGQLQKVQLTQLQKSLNRGITEVFNSIQGDIEQSIKDIANLAVQANTALLEDCGIYLKGAYAHVPTDVYAAISGGKVYDQKWFLSDAVWGDVKAKQNILSKIVADGMAQNKSAYDIAKELEGFVSPSAAKTWNWNKVYPGSGKTIDYCAQRLARTLVSHAYQKSLVDTVKDNPFVTGIEWRSAFAHGRTCQLCMDRDGTVYKPQELPIDHPNGLCTYLTQQASLKDTADRLTDWVNGKDDPALDKYAESMLPNFKQAAAQAAVNKITLNKVDSDWLKKLKFDENNLPDDYKKFYNDLFDNNDLTDSLDFANYVVGKYGNTSDAIEKYFNAELKPFIEQQKQAAQQGKKVLSKAQQDLLDKFYNKYNYDKVPSFTKWYNEIGTDTDNFDELFDMLGNNIDDWKKWYKENISNVVKSLDNDAAAVVKKMTPIQEKFLGKYGYDLDNMPNSFTEWSHKLPADVIEELQKKLGIYSSDHPFQELEKWYNSNILNDKTKNIKTAAQQVKAAKQTNASVIANKIKNNAAFDTDSFDDILKGNDLLDDKEFEGRYYKEKWLDWFKKWKKSCDVEEWEGAKTYTGGAYENMNAYLRGISSNNRYPTAIENCRKSLDKSYLPEDIIVRRGSDEISLKGLVGDLKFDLEKNYTDIIGTVVEDKGFMSTSPLKDGGFSPSGVEYRILLPKGAKAQFLAPISNYKSEQEILVQAGTKFVVKDIVYNPSNWSKAYTVYMTAIV